MDKTCRECGQDIPGLVIAVCSEAEPEEIIKLARVDSLEASRAAARQFARFCFSAASARYMDEFTAEYRRLKRGMV